MEVIREAWDILRHKSQELMEVDQCLSNHNIYSSSNQQKY